MDWGNGYTVEPLHNGHLGERRKWPLQRGLNYSQCMDSLPKKVAAVESWSSIVNCSLSGMTYFEIL